MDDPIVDSNTIRKHVMCPSCFNDIEIILFKATWKKLILRVKLNEIRKLLLSMKTKENSKLIRDIIFDINALETFETGELVEYNKDLF